MKRNCEYQRYHGFHLTPRELRFGIGTTRNGLRCTRVRVWCGKIRPTVYLCSTLQTAPSPRAHSTNHYHLHSTTSCSNRSSPIDMQSPPSTHTLFVINLLLPPIEPHPPLST